MNWSNPHFAEPAWLWLAVLGPAALFVLQRYSASRRRRQLASIASAQAAVALAGSVSRIRRGIKNALLLAALAGIGLALARPQWGEQRDAGQVLGEDVIFLLDCSKSMLATDVLPNRLQKAKLAILDYVQNHGTGRAGLVAFAGQAFLQCPLTFDHTAFGEALLAVDERTIAVPGTDIGRALDEAARGIPPTGRQRLVIALTDGEDLEKGGVKTAEGLARRGIVVFTIGVGTEAGAEISFLNEQGQSVVVRDKQGQPVRSRLDEATLRSIAVATRGAYFPLGELGEGLAKVKLAVSSMDLGQGTSPARKLGIDRFHVPVAAALLLLAAESLIGTRRRVREVSF